MAEIGVHARGVPGVSEDHATIPVWNSEDWYFEDFEVGDEIRWIRRTISQGESILFKSLVTDHHPDVSDERFAAEEGAFGKRIAASAVVFSCGCDCLRSLRQSSLETRSMQFAKTCRMRSRSQRWARCESSTRCSRERACLFSIASP